MSPSLPPLFMQHSHFLKTWKPLPHPPNTIWGRGESSFSPLWVEVTHQLQQSYRNRGCRCLPLPPPPTLQGTTKGKWIPQTTHSSTSEQGSKTWSESWAKIPVLYCIINCRPELCCKAACTLKTSWFDQHSFSLPLSFSFPSSLPSWMNSFHLLCC